jgi:hypothetical protein
MGRGIAMGWPSHRRGRGGEWAAAATTMGRGEGNEPSADFSISFSFFFFPDFQCYV